MTLSSFSCRLSRLCGISPAKLQNNLFRGIFLFLPPAGFPFPIAISPAKLQNGHFRGIFLFLLPAGLPFPIAISPAKLQNNHFRGICVSSATFFICTSKKLLAECLSQSKKPPNAKPPGTKCSRGYPSLACARLVIGTNSPWAVPYSLCIEKESVS